MYLLTLDPTFTCTAKKYCGNRKTASIRKNKAEVEKMCVEDSSCKAIDYSEHHGYGHLCTSTTFIAVGTYEACAIFRGTDGYVKLF